MVNYQNGKIYKIVSNTDDDICYVGSTTKKYLSQRMDTHRKNYKCWKNGKYGNLTSFEIFEKYGFENCRIELLELVPCNSKDELTKKEGQYIRALNCVNKCIAGRTQKQWEEENRDKMLETKKNYYQNNKDILSEKAKIYRDQNKEYISEYNKKWANKNKEKLSEYNKIYREQNKVKIAERQKKYREANNNKEQILEKQKEKYTCCCGSNIQISGKSRHENKSKKHIEFMKSQSI